MVLKRLLVTTLSALGFGALMAGTAFGQTAPGDGNIPAPDLFNDQITCSMNLPTLGAVQMPTKVARGADESVLDTIIKATKGDSPRDITDAEKDTLGYVIPPGTNNCGNGTIMTAFTVADQGSIATDVAMGYSALLDAYMVVYGNPGDATMKGTAGAVADIQEQIRKLDPASLTYQSQLTALQAQLETASEADTKARATYNALANGPIYQAGVTEWMAKAAVTDAVADYNMKRTTATNSKTALDGTDHDTYIDLEFDHAGEENLVNADGSVNLTNVRTYVSATTDGVSTTDNFDDNGNLIIPMRETTDPDDGDAMEPTPVTKGIGAIRTDRDSSAEAVTALRTALAAQTDPQTRTLLESALRRAELEAAHFEAEYIQAIGNNDEVVADDPGTLTVNEFESIATRAAKFNADEAKRATSESALRTAAAAREAATSGVAVAFQSPGSFYQQLVDRRQALKDMADAAVTRASANGATPPVATTKAASDAAAALVKADEALAAYQALVSDADDPTIALINELLKTEKGDDGQALVDAISATYDTANEAAEKADQVEESVAGLVGDDGAVGMNAAAIQENSDDIVALDGRVATNEDDIEALDGRVTTNEGMIMTNAGNIATNAAGIMTNAGHIMENRGMIETNAEDIMTNAGNISMNSGRIDVNEMAIASNASDIANNANMIGSNSASISDNRNMIGELSESLEVVRAGVAASMALAGMPAINGRGISIGVGSFDGESAFAVGFQIQGEMASFKVGLTSGGGATGASAGVGFQF